MAVPERTEDWVPAFEMEGIEPFAQNMIDIFKRDQKPALAWAARGDALPDFKVFNNSKRLNQDWAALSVIPRQEASPIFDNGLMVQPRHVVEIEIEDKGSDANQLVWSVVRRVKAVRAMIWSANVINDLCAGIEAGKYLAPTVEITPAVYASFINKAGTIYLQYASLTVTLDLLEN